jgi:hypothetical protein
VPRRVPGSLTLVLAKKRPDGVFSTASPHTKLSWVKKRARKTYLDGRQYAGFISNEIPMKKILIADAMFSALALRLHALHEDPEDEHDEVNRGI